MRRDLINGPRHCFGIHSDCSTDNCKAVRSAQVPPTSGAAEASTSGTAEASTSGTVEASTSVTVEVSTPGTAEGPESLGTVVSQEGQFWLDATSEGELEAVRSVAPQLPANVDPEMIRDIQHIVGRLVAKADKLLGERDNTFGLQHIHLHLHVHVHACTKCTGINYRFCAGNFTTNLAESWTHIRAKFDGGKVINRSQSGSWEARCSGAGLRANEGPEWGPKTWERVTGEAANPVFAAASAEKARQVEVDRKRKATDGLNLADVHLSSPRQMTTLCRQGETTLDTTTAMGYERWTRSL